MAPEQALGAKVDGRADLFSLGATGYALLTGQLAFAAENVVAIIGRVTRHDPPPPSQLVPGIPAHVDYIVARALAKDPDDRYLDGKTFAEDIDDAINGRPPRHRAHWTPPRRADGTMVSTVADMAPAATAPPPAPRPKTARPAVSAPRPATPATGALRGGRAAPPASRAKIWVALIAAALAGGAIAAAVVLRTMSPKPAGPPATTAPADIVRVDPAESEPTRVRKRAADAAAGSGRLAIDFQHPLKSGTLRVWVDDTLVLEKKLASKAKRIVAVTVRSGSVREVVPVAAGEHDVRVEVSWDDQRKTGALFGSIEADETRTLEIRMPPVLKALMMELK